MQKRISGTGLVVLQEQKFKEREDALMTKNTKLQESLASFSKYLQENDAKRARANKRAVDEAHLCEEKSQEAQDLVSVESCTFQKTIRPFCTSAW